MNKTLACPRCNQLTNPQARNCEHCGVDLALAAVLAEQSLPIQRWPSDIPITPEVLVPRLGDYLIEKGIITHEDLRKALEYQQIKLKNGETCLIGQAFIELGLIDRPTLDKAITEQIFYLQNALKRANQSLEKRVQERTEELQRALNKLSELNQLKSNFISNISHELRTPLTHIKGYLDILAEGSLGPLNPQQLDAIKALQRAEKRLEQLIEDLIQFSLASRSELTMKFTSFDLNQIIQTTIEKTQQRAKENQITLTTIVPEKLPKVWADKEKIEWVLMQLVDNALKFTPKGGKVQIRVVSDNGLVHIEVIDTGIGIPHERIPEIFEPFHQLDGSPSRRYPGTGIGLTLVKKILDAHGCEIRVNSHIGKGSCFRFSIPIAKV